jgi:hypothetical protein
MISLSHITYQDPDNFIETRLVAVHSRRLAALVDWYYEQTTQRLKTWFNLNDEAFQNWYERLLSTHPPL